MTTYVYDEFNDPVAKTDGVANALATSDERLSQMRSWASPRRSRG